MSSDVSVVTPGDGMLHPLALLGLLALVLNDHWAKGNLPAALTNKLSDVAGIGFFPLLLESLWELLSARYAPPPWRPSRRTLWACVALTGVVFALVKTTHTGHALYGVSVAALQWPFRAVFSLCTAGHAPPLARISCVRDPTDLVALAALWVPLRVGSARRAALR